MMDHLDPCAGSIDKVLVRDLVVMIKKSMKRKPDKRPSLVSIVNTLHRLETDSPASKLRDDDSAPSRLQAKGSFSSAETNSLARDARTVLCDCCCTSHEICYACDGKHRICAHCIDSQERKVGKNMSIVCPIDNCRKGFDGLKLKQALGESRYNDYVVRLEFLRNWQETIVDTIQKIVRDANKDVLQAFRHREDRFMSINKNNQEDMKEVKKSLLDHMETLRTVEDGVARAQGVLNFLATGDSIPCPKLVWLVPCETDCNTLISLLKIPVMSSWKLFFVCEKSYKLANPDSPIKLELHRQWLRNFAPILKASLVALEIAGAVKGLTVPPTFRKTTDEFMRRYDSMLTVVMNEQSLKAVTDPANESQAYKAIGTLTETKNWKNVAQMKLLTGESYRFFSEIVNEPERRKKWEPLMKIEKVQGRLVWVAKDASGRKTEH